MEGLYVFLAVSLMVNALVVYALITETREGRQRIRDIYKTLEGEKEE